MEDNYKYSALHFLGFIAGNIVTLNKDKLEFIKLFDVKNDN